MNERLYDASTDTFRDRTQDDHEFVVTLTLTSTKNSDDICSDFCAYMVGYAPLSLQSIKVEQIA